MEAEDKKRLIYYFQGLLPLLIVVMVMSVMDVDILNIFLFMSSFIWLFTMGTPGLRDVTYKKKYKLSFINTITRLGDVISEHLEKAPPFISRYSKWILPILFLGTACLSARVGNLFFLFFGLFFVELVNYTKKEIPRNLF